MLENVKIQFYKINKCGFYRYAGEEPEFGSMEETLADLEAWVKSDGKALVETSTFETEDSESILKTYCFDIESESSTGDFLLVLWNETPSDEGRVASVNGSQPVGKVDVDYTDLPDGFIPGYATYFWIIPDLNIYASIRFSNNRMIGKDNLEQYIKEFMAKFSEFVLLSDKPDEDGNYEILGYENAGKDYFDVRSDFKSYIYNKEGEIDFLTKNREKISKIIKKNKLQSKIQVDRTLWESFLDSLNLGSNKNYSISDVKVKFEVPFTPTQGEIEAIIKSWETDHQTKWDDVGFKLKGENKIYWLSHSVAKDEVHLDVVRDNNEIVEAKSLLLAITSIRKKLLLLIKSK